jgi:hypothetical protein
MDIVKKDKKDTRLDWVVVIGTTSGWQEVIIPLNDDEEEEESS